MEAGPSFMCFSIMNIPGGSDAQRFENSDVSFDALFASGSFHLTTLLKQGGETE